MNPGDEGGWLPSMCLLRRQRKKKQQPNRAAPTPSRAKGTPMPMPIFWRLVSPVVLNAGAAVSGARVNVEAGLVVMDLEGLEVEDPCEDMAVDRPLDDDGTGLASVVVELRGYDLDGEDNCIALLGTDSDGCHQSVSVAVVDTWPSQL